MLGAGGMFVESADPPEVGETLTMEFALPGLEGPVEIRAEVAWRRVGDAPDSPGMGLRFLDVEDALRQRIGGFVEQQQNRDDG